MSLGEAQLADQEPILGLAMSEGHTREARAPPVDPGLIANRGSDVDQAHRRAQPTGRLSVGAGRLDHQRNVNDLFEERASVTPTPVIAELLPVVRGEDEDRLVPQTQLLESIDQTTHLGITERDLRLVQRTQIVDVFLVDLLGHRVGRPLSLELSVQGTVVAVADEARTLLRSRVVGRMGVDGVHVEEERFLPFTDPLHRSVDDEIRAYFRVPIGIQDELEGVEAARETELRTEDPSVRTEGSGSVPGLVEDLGQGADVRRKTILRHLDTMFGGEQGGEDARHRRLCPRRRRHRLLEDEALLGQGAQAWSCFLLVSVERQVIRPQRVHEKDDDVTGSPGGIHSTGLRTGPRQQEQGRGDRQMPHRHTSSVRFVKRAHNQREVLPAPRVASKV